MFLYYYQGIPVNVITECVNMSFDLSNILSFGGGDAHWSPAQLKCNQRTSEPSWPQNGDSLTKDESAIWKELRVQHTRLVHSHWKRQENHTLQSSIANFCAQVLDLWDQSLDSVEESAELFNLLEERFASEKSNLLPKTVDWIQNQLDGVKFWKEYCLVKHSSFQRQAESYWAWVDHTDTLSRGELSDFPEQEVFALFKDLSKLMKLLSTPATRKLPAWIHRRLSQFCREHLQDLLFNLGDLQSSSLYFYECELEEAKVYCRFLKETDPDNKAAYRESRAYLRQIQSRMHGEKVFAQALIKSLKGMESNCQGLEKIESEYRWISKTLKKIESQTKGYQTSLMKAGSQSSCKFWGIKKLEEIKAKRESAFQDALDSPIATQEKKSFLKKARHEDDLEKEPPLWKKGFLGVSKVAFTWFQLDGLSATQRLWKVGNNAYASWESGHLHQTEDAEYCQQYPSDEACQLKDRAHHAHEMLRDTAFEQTLHREFAYVNKILSEYTLDHLRTGDLAQKVGSQYGSRVKESIQIILQEHSDLIGKIPSELIEEQSDKFIRRYYKFPNFFATNEVNERLSKSYSSIEENDGEIEFWKERICEYPRGGDEGDSLQELEEGFKGLLKRVRYLSAVLQGLKTDKRYGLYQLQVSLWEEIQACRESVREGLCVDGSSVNMDVLSAKLANMSGRLESLEKQSRKYQRLEIHEEEKPLDLEESTLEQLEEDVQPVESESPVEFMQSEDVIEGDSVSGTSAECSDDHLHFYLTRTPVQDSSAKAENLLNQVTQFKYRIVESVRNLEEMFSDLSYFGKSKNALREDLKVLGGFYGSSGLALEKQWLHKEIQEFQDKEITDLKTKKRVDEALGDIVWYLENIDDLFMQEQLFRSHSIDIIKLWLHRFKPDFDESELKEVASWQVNGGEIPSILLGGNEFDLSSFSSQLKEEFKELTEDIAAIHDDSRFSNHLRLFEMYMRRINKVFNAIEENGSDFVSFLDFSSLEFLGQHVLDSLMQDFQWIDRNGTQVNNVPLAFFVLSLDIKSLYVRFHYTKNKVAGEAFPDDLLLSHKESNLFEQSTSLLVHTSELELRDLFELVSDVLEFLPVCLEQKKLRDRLQAVRNSVEIEDDYQASQKELLEILFNNLFLQESVFVSKELSNRSSALVRGVMVLQQAVATKTDSHLQKDIASAYFESRQLQQLVESLESVYRVYENPKRYFQRELHAYAQRFVGWREYMRLELGVDFPDGILEEVLRTILLDREDLRSGVQDINDKLYNGISWFGYKRQAVEDFAQENTRFSEKKFPLSLEEHYALLKSTLIENADLYHVAWDLFDYYQDEKRILELLSASGDTVFSYCLFWFGSDISWMDKTGINFWRHSRFLDRAYHFFVFAFEEAAKQQNTDLFLTLMKHFGRVETYVRVHHEDFF